MSLIGLRITNKVFVFSDNRLSEDNASIHRAENRNYLFKLSESDIFQKQNTKNEKTYYYQENYLFTAKLWMRQVSMLFCQLYLLGIIGLHTFYEMKS